jgi:hypothetical protein
VRNRTLVLLALVGACEPNDPGDSVHMAHEDHVSFVIPAGYRLTRERDTWVLVGEGEREGSTIALRSVPRDGWSEDRSPEMLRPAVEQVLRGFPDASVRGPAVVENAPYPGFAFDVTYAPPSRKGQRVRRRHAVLVSTGRVFHILETWPVTHAESGKADFARVISSVREEG